MLKPCRECGEKVSTEAKACPKCGANRPTLSKSSAESANAIRQFMVIAFFIAIVAWLYLNFF